MALKFLTPAKDIFPMNTALVGRKTATAIEPGIAQGEARPLVYYDRTDKIFVLGRQAGDTPVTQAIRYEPLFLDTSASGIDSGGATSGFGGNLHYAVGQFNTATSSQRIYTAASATAGSVQWAENDPDDFTNISTDPYPNIQVAFSNNGITSGNPGHWSTGRGSLFFEGLTDGIAGVTTLTGSNVYPKGLMMIQVTAATVVTSGDANNAIIWVDIDTGDSVGIVAVAGGTASAPTINKEPLIGGDTFDWEHFQYIPDDDQTFAKPKGELLISSRKKFIVTGAGTEKIYLRWVEFNPLGVTGTPTRTHLQFVLTTRLEYENDPVFNISGGPSNTTSQSSVAIYHPVTRRVLVMAGGEQPVGATNTVADDWYVGAFSRQPGISTISPVIAPRIPRTNDVALFETQIQGSLGEAVAGVSATWTLQQISTFGESLTFSPDQEIGATATVGNIPIDANDAGDPEGTLVVKGDGTPLVEPTDYTVVLSTGVITLASSQTGKVMTADYQHTTSPDTANSHGSLLNATSTSDTDGRAVARVRYADNSNLVGELDEIEVSVDDTQ